MNDNLLTAVLNYAWLPVAAAILGGIIATFRPPGSKIRSVIQHVAAGVVFSVVAVELLPHVVSEHRPMPTIIGFALGVALMLTISTLTGGFEKLASNEQAEAGGRRESGLPVGMLVAVAVDLLIDGFLIGIGFSTGAKEGRLLTLALTIELLSLGLAVAVTLGKTGQPRGRGIVIIAMLASLILVGAIGGVTILRGLSSGALDVVLSFGLAALLFLVTEELLVEAHEEVDTPFATATFFAGFLLFLVLGMIS